MRYKLFGKSGLRVSELCLGTMTFGEEWGWGSSEEEAKKIFDMFVAAGGNFIDTADKYTEGHSEKLLGQFMGKEREQFVLATKFTSNMRPNDPNGGGNHRKRITEALHASLKRLNTDYIDIYWLHAWDFLTPIQEVMRALDDMVAAGKVLYIGISDTPAWIISQANTIAELRGWTAFTGIQIEYSLIERTPERDLLPMAKALDLAVTAWSPLASGLLSGKYNKPAEKSETNRLNVTHFVQLDERNLHIAKEVTQIAEEIGKSPAQVALNWVRQQNHTIPIIGARKLPQVIDNLKCLEFKLTDDQLKRLDNVSKVALGFPHEFLARQEIRKVIFGETEHLIDKHR